MLFCKQERPGIVKKNPKMAFGEVGKALGAAWGKLSDAQKAKYKKYTSRLYDLASGPRCETRPCERCARDVSG